VNTHMECGLSSGQELFAPLCCGVRVSAGGAHRLSSTFVSEKVHLVEEQVLGLQRVAVGEIDCRPPELNGSSCRRDITIGGVEHAIMGARQGPFGRCSWPVGEELLDLKAEARERFLEHTQEANDVVATAGLAA
jgi:hypothetical protein